MSPGKPLDIADATTADTPALVDTSNDQTVLGKQDPHFSTAEELTGPNGEQYPTNEDWATLRRVYGKVNWMIYVIGVVEMCERFAYYGTTAVCMCAIESTNT